MSLDYTLAAGPTKFIVGTDSGVLFSCNRKGGKTPADRITSAHTGARRLSTYSNPQTLSLCCTSAILLSIMLAACKPAVRETKRVRQVAPEENTQHPIWTQTLRGK